MSHFDPRTNQYELEVQRIIHLQNLANQLSYAFVDTKKVTKSYILTKNALARVDVPNGQKESECMHLKRGRPIGSKDTNPRKRKTKGKLGNLEETRIEQDVAVEAHNEQETPKKV